MIGIATLIQANVLVSMPSDVFDCAGNFEDYAF